MRNVYGKKPWGAWSCQLAASDLVTDEGRIWKNPRIEMLLKSGTSIFIFHHFRIFILIYIYIYIIHQRANTHCPDGDGETHTHNMYSMIICIVRGFQL